MSSGGPRKPPHVPAHYVSRHIERFVFWGIDGYDSLAATLVPDCFERIEQLLQFRLRRTVHVVVYATNEDARAALDRDVPPSMLLAPFHTYEEALLALQAPSVDARNGDERRMRRHICHELAHVFAAERTGSLKRLGDENRTMTIASWVDEGFAEVLSAHLADRPDIIDAAVTKAETTSLTDEELIAAFCNLMSPNRSAAFAIATIRVWRAVARHGYRFVFDHLDDVSAWR